VFNRPKGQPASEAVAARNDPRGLLSGGGLASGGFVSYSVHRV